MKYIGREDDWCPLLVLPFCVNNLYTVNYIFATDMSENELKTYLKSAHLTSNYDSDIYKTFYFENTDSTKTLVLHYFKNIKNIEDLRSGGFLQVGRTDKPYIIKVSDDDYVEFKKAFE